MGLFGNGRKQKRRGRLLTAEQIDKEKLMSDHTREQRVLNAQAYAGIVAKWSALVGVPILYLGLIYLNRHDLNTVNTYLWSGITAVAGFAFGRVSDENKPKS